ncbi:hypothetical protein F0562_031127 [Nyssa sinensis]|uniref:Uncharacterized protein n=1 Tax=Nyssa sinensis TaxID=561372 RepID=A0A5J5ASY6_9ASTE|nr:hypothetical protein F0562_031127 [Nyssa sinensis]
MASVPACPANSFRYNTTLCACIPAYLYNATTNRCTLFRVYDNEVEVDSGVEYSVTIPETIFSFDSIKRFTQSQAVFLEATLIILLSWLLFCFFARFGKLGDGRTIWFRIRWWISRRFEQLLAYGTTLIIKDDQKVVMKRKTELGGTFSIASLILFIGLFAALLYQIISKRTIEVHNVRAANAPDLASFINDMEFNITTISSMSCSHLRGLGTLVIGNPGFIDYRVASLSTFANFLCQNTTKGPTISFKCNNCRLIRDNVYISWQFVDLPNDPATAVGFQFNLTAKSHANKKYISFVSGTLKNGSNLDDKPVTFRGADPNILKFNLFPRVYHNLHDLKLIQPLFHEFLPGSSLSNTSQLQASLQSSNGGLVNTTLCVNFLSAYIVEINNQSILGPVSFLADLGGLYCISFGIFFYFLVQCEYRIKKLRNEDSIMRKIRNRRKAQERWDKLRKYVMYTWGCSTLDDDYNNVGKEACCTGVMIESFHKKGSLRKQSQQNRMDSICFNKKVNLPSEKKATPERMHTPMVKSCLTKSASTLDKRLSCSRGEPVLESEVFGAEKDEKHEHAICLPGGDVSQPQVFPTADDYTLTLPPLPSFEFKAGSEINMSDIQKNLQDLYEYNAMLRNKLVSAQSLLHALSNEGLIFSDGKPEIATHMSERSSHNSTILEMSLGISQELVVKHSGNMSLGREAVYS